jgi:hypothetical protein
MASPWIKAACLVAAMPLCGRDGIRPIDNRPGRVTRKGRAPTAYGDGEYGAAEGGKALCAQIIISPLRIPRVTASVRVLAFNLARIEFTWNFAV